MEIAIYDKSGIKQEILQNTWSIQWIRCYDKTGSFEIHAKGTTSNIKYLKTGNRLVNQRTSEIGFITYVYPYTLATGEEDIEVRGFLNNLDDRINPTTSTITKVEKGLYDLVNKNKRGLEITCAPEKGLTETIKDGMDTTWKSLKESFETVCQQSMLGFRMIRKNKIMNVIEIYKRGIVSNVKFSDEIGNILSQSYLENISNYKNYIYVACQGQGKERIVYEIDLTKGNPRKELYVDGRSLSWTWYDDKEVEHTYTASEYKNQAIKYAMEQLESYAAINEFTCDIASGDSLFVFRQDYDLGDVIRTKSVKYGLLENFRISEINEISENGDSFKITLQKYEE